MKDNAQVYSKKVHLQSRHIVPSGCLLARIKFTKFDSDLYDNFSRNRKSIARAYVEWNESWFVNVNPKTKSNREIWFCCSGQEGEKSQTHWSVEGCDGWTRHSRCSGKAFRTATRNEFARSSTCWRTQSSIFACFESWLASKKQFGGSRKAKSRVAHRKKKIGEQLAR